MYKLSKYNYIVESGQKFVYFNGITSHTFSLTEKEHEKISKLFNDLISFHIQYTTVFNRFKEWGFIVDENTEEVDIIKYRNKQSVFLDRCYHLIINPTEECVFNCWYCTQHKVNSGRMTSEVIERVKKHIDIMIKNERVPGMNLDWFGGEPLMYFDEVMYPIAKHTIEIVDQYNLPFSHHITTNSYLITPDIVQKMIEIRLNSFQITIDGDEKRHNTIRNINGKPTFRRIMDNIELICENIDNSNIVLRLNYDNTTLTISNLRSVYEQIPQHLRKHISLDFQRVWQTTNSISQPAKTNKNLHDLYESVVSLGFIPSHASSTFRCGKAIRCYSDRFFHTVINYTGIIHKCTLYLEREAGVLNEDGTISWHQETMNKLYAKATFDNEKCLACKHLSICLGPCSQAMYDKSKEIPCVLDNSEITPNQFIIDVYNRKMDSIRNIKMMDA